MRHSLVTTFDFAQTAEGGSAWAGGGVDMYIYCESFQMVDELWMTPIHADIDEMQSIYVSRCNCAWGLMPASA